MRSASSGNMAGRGQVVIAHEIADFVLATSWSTLPEIVRKEARRAFLN